jgi:hypothetical protein
MQQVSAVLFPQMTTAQRDVAAAAGRLPVPTIIENTDFTPAKLQQQTAAGVWQDVGTGAALSPAEQLWLS